MGSRYRLTTVWAIRSDTVDIPSGLVRPSPFGMSTRRTAGENSSPRTSGSRPCTGYCSGASRRFSSSPRRCPLRHGSPLPVCTPPALHAWKYKTVLPYPCGSSPIGLTRKIMPDNDAPSVRSPLQHLHPSYGRLRPCAPHRYSHPCGVPPLGLLPCHRGDRFLRSSPEPGPRSRRLHAGRRSGSKQVNPRPYHGIDIQIPVSTSSVYVTTRHQRFTRVRLRDPHLTESSSAFSFNAHHEGS